MYKGLRRPRTLEKKGLSSPAKGFNACFNRPCSFPSPIPLFGHISTRSGCFPEKVKVKVKLIDLDVQT